MILLPRLLAGTFALGLTVAACGGTDDSRLEAPAPEDSNPQSNPGGDFGDPLAPGGVFAACATSSANAALTPANLVMMYDRSGSMGDMKNDPPFDPKLKWIPVSSGMKAFLTDPGSATLNASLQFFPIGETLEQVCSHEYAKPEVALSPLTNSSAFVAAIDGVKPQGGTPTLPAMAGAIAYARQIAAQHPRDTTVVVLITDGEPGITVNKVFSEGCPNNDIPNVAKAAKEALGKSIRTYVIGVGPSLEKLNAIAAAGGTGQAIMVDVQDPAKTTVQFQKALEQIRRQTMACDFAIPPAPAGKTLSANLVNVVYTGTNGQHKILPYSKDCSAAEGWHYDNPNAPKKIELCSATCSAAQADRTGKLTLAFGCTTKGNLN